LFAAWTLERYIDILSQIWKILFEKSLKMGEKGIIISISNPNESSYDKYHGD
jgi:cAMP phosphodiesterase